VQAADQSGTTRTTPHKTHGGGVSMRAAATPTPGPDPSAERHTDLSGFGSTQLIPTSPRVLPDSEDHPEEAPGHQEAPSPKPQAPGLSGSGDAGTIAGDPEVGAEHPSATDAVWPGARGPRLGAALEELLDGRRLWRRDGHHHTALTGLPTTWPALDAALPGGGWPPACLTELLCPHPGSGELSLVLPALAELAASGGWICWISPPHVPYPPALAALGLDLSRQLLVEVPDALAGLWAMEQALRSGSCDAVLAWAEPREAHWPRRLQLAAEQGEARGFLFRDLRAGRCPSAAALRLRLAPGEVEILKCRGGRPARLHRQHPG